VGLLGKAMQVAMEVQMMEQAVAVAVLLLLAQMLLLPLVAMAVMARHRL
jgi:hypothetical protein